MSLGQDYMVGISDGGRFYIQAVSGDGKVIGKLQPRTLTVMLWPLSRSVKGIMLSFIQALTRVTPFGRFLLVESCRRKQQRVESFVKNTLS